MYSNRDVISPLLGPERRKQSYDSLMTGSKRTKSVWRLWWKPILIGAAALVLNLLAYLLLPPSLLTRLGRLGYLGAFGIAALANATVLVPVPYYPIIIRLAQALNVWGVVLAAAAGSTLGECVAFFVGCSSHGAIEETRVNNWIERQMQRPWRAGLVLFVLAALPNPAFDVAGLLAGAFGLPLWLFLLPVFLGRIVRMALLGFVGLNIEGWI